MARDGFKVFCKEKTASNGNTYWQGYAGKKMGKITVFEVADKKNGGTQLVVNIAHPYKLGMARLRAVTSNRGNQGGSSGGYFPSNRNFYNR